MILRDGIGNAIGHTEVIDTLPIPAKRTETLTALSPSKGLTDTQNWSAMLWATALLPENF